MALVLFVAGMIALLVGKISLTPALSVEGNRARIFGGFLVAPWLLAFATNQVMGAAQPITESSGSTGGFFGGLIFWGFSISAFVYLAITRMNDIDRAKPNLDVDEDEPREMADRAAA